LFDEKVLDVVSSQLLTDFNKKSKDRNHIDAMAWICKALGASGKSKYRNALSTVMKDSKNRKLRGYAKKSLAQL